MLVVKGNSDVWVSWTAVVPLLPRLAGAGGVRCRSSALSDSPIRANGGGGKSLNHESKTRYFGNAHLGRNTFCLSQVQQKWGSALVLSCAVSSRVKVKKEVKNKC